MRLLSVFVSFNRLEMLQRALATYADTVTLPHDVVVVDNASDAETRDWLSSSGHTVLLLPANRHLGYATNRAFRLRDERHTLLHRSDNDVVYLPGWCEEMNPLFSDRKIGLVGLRDDKGDEYADNPGGNAVIRSTVWDQGVRYSDEPWDTCPWHDAELTRRVVAAGWKWTRVKRPGIVHKGSTDPQDPYFRGTMLIRGVEV